MGITVYMGGSAWEDINDPLWYTFELLEDDSFNDKYRYAAKMTSPSRLNCDPIIVRDWLAEAGIDHIETFNRTWVFTNAVDRLWLLSTWP